MPKQAKLIVFDWDGTLYRSTDWIAESIVWAGQSVGHQIPKATAREVIGLGLKASERHLFPAIDRPSPEFLAAFHRAYRERYESGEENLSLYDGAFELLRDLSATGKIVAIATAKSRVGIDRSLSKTGLAAFVSHSRTPNECRPKPDPQMLHALIDAAKVNPEETLMIGDTTHDLQMAVNAGVHGIGLSHGAHSAPQLQTFAAFPLCDDIAALRQLLL